MDKKTIIILLLFPLVCFGQATNTWTVGTASRNYSTIQGCEDAKNDDQVTNNEIDICECYDDSDFTEAVNVDGGTNDATRYFEITVASGERHPGTNLAGGAKNAPTSGQRVFTLNDSYVKLRWLIIEGTGMNESTAVRALEPDQTITHVIADSVKGTSGRGLFWASDLRITFENCIGIDGSTENFNMDGNNGKAINCTAFSGGDGFQVSSGDTDNEIKNCAAFDNSNNDYDDQGTSTTMSYSISSDATATGTGSLTNKNSGDNFVATGEGAENLHLKSGADAEDAGTNTGAPSDDIDGDSRPQNGTVDMGADEIVAAEAFDPGRLPQIIKIFDKVNSLYATKDTVSLPVTRAE